MGISAYPGGMGWNLRSEISDLRAFFSDLQAFDLGELMFESQH